MSYYKIGFKNLLSRKRLLSDIDSQNELLRIENASIVGRVSAFSSQIKRGQRIHLLGPNGAGKSSVLAMLAGWLSFSGKIEFLGYELSAWPRAQLANYRAWLHQQQSPSHNMTLHHYIRQYLPEKSESIFHEQVMNKICQKLQLTKKLTYPLKELSGGEWQRSRLAAILLQMSFEINPSASLLLLDEPMTGLDIAQQQVINDLLQEQCKKGMTVIMTDHDLNNSLCQADIVWLMKNGEVIMQGNSQEVLQPYYLNTIFDVKFQRITLNHRDFIFSDTEIKQ